MASSGKKGKKNKGVVISLQSFLSNGDAQPAGTTQVSKKLRNIDGDESDDGSTTLPQVYQLPTAPRANRIFDDDSIPYKAPFIAYVSNLPFDANEEDIHDFFGAIPIVSLRLPREEHETGRVRGFGYVEFDTREDLIDVLSMPDPTIKGRRIRIDLSNESEQQNNRQRGNRRGFDGFGSSGENRDSTNWRRDNQNQQDAGGSSYGNYDRGYNRDSNRDNNRDRKPLSSEETSGAPGSWRTGTRPLPSDSSPRADRDNDRHRDMGRSNRDFNRQDRERNFESGPSAAHDQESSQERPKLVLKPRTLPLPEIVTKLDEETADIEESASEEAKPLPKPSGISSEKVFGSAKPVDTATRELEIEERLAEARRQEKIVHDEEHSEDVDKKLSEIQLDKVEKETSNTAISWRRKNDADLQSKNAGKNNNPEKGAASQDLSRRDNRDSDYNRNSKNRDKSEKTEPQKSKSNQNQDEKLHEEQKSKHDIKVARPLPKYELDRTDPILQYTNKYSGLDDEDVDDVE